MAFRVIVDEGSSFVKAQIVGDNASTIIFPSRVLNKKVRDMTTGTLVSDRCYMVDGSYYTVMPSTDEPQTTSNGEEFQTSAINMVLVHDALRLMGLGGQNVDLTVTLPIKLFFAGDDGFNRELIIRKKARLVSDIKHINSHDIAKVSSVTVRPEGYSIALDAILDDNGELKKQFEDIVKIFVVDIGGTTTDMALMTMEGSVERWTSSRNAVFPLREDIENCLVSAMDLDEVNISTMDKILTTGFLGQHDVNDVVTSCAKRQAQGIIKDMNSFAGSMSSIDLLVIAGGGAYTIGQHIRNNFQNVPTVIPNQPELSVMRGYEKFARASETA